MLTIIFPRTINWFYRHQAELLVEELRGLGLDVASVSSDDLATLSTRCGDALILSLWETVTDAERAGVEDAFIAMLRTFDRRTLFNYDALDTQYFRRHFTKGVDLLTDIIDVSMIRQTTLDSIYGIPVVWISEAFTAAEMAATIPWSDGRPIPWVSMGHTNAARAALVTACIRTLGPSGFVFMPPIRPYSQDSGLERAGIHRILERADLYVWGSHHSSPYHEGLRALHAVAAGAIPAKIDPIHHAMFAELPWVYPSVSALADACANRGLQAMYGEAKRHLQSNGTLGSLVIRALRHDPSRATRPVTVGRASTLREAEMGQPS